jgi:hypothetical protein
MSGDAWKEGGIDATGISIAVCTSHSKASVCCAVFWSVTHAYMKYLQKRKRFQGFQTPYIYIKDLNSFLCIVLLIVNSVVSGYCYHQIVRTENSAFIFIRGKK